MIQLLRGTGEGIICNGYFFDGVIIDAPFGCRFPDAELMIITHPHCDHFYRAGLFKGKKAASLYGKGIINSKSKNCLCDYIGWDFPDVKIDRGLNNGEKIKTKNYCLEVIDTPGHCLGSICLYEPELKILFSGDTIFPDFNLPRTDLPTSDINALKKSCQILSKLEIETIYPGHGKKIKEKRYIEKILGII